MFAIGTLEREEAADLASHIEQSCQTCTAELERSMRFWAVFAMATTDEAEMPMGRNVIDFLPLSTKAAAPIAIDRKKHQAPTPWWQWTAAAAVLATICTFGAWYFTQPHPGNPPAQQQTANLERRVTELARERDRLLQQRDQAREAAKATPPAVPAENNMERALAARNSELHVAERAVAELRQQFASDEQALRDARLRATRLEAELSDQQTKLAAAQTEQSRALAQLSEAAETRRRAEAQVELLRVQVQQLTQQRAELLQTVQLRERQSIESLRMISLLSSPQTKLIHVVGTESAPEARGYALLTADNGVLFFASGLPALPVGRDYQLWLIRGKSPAIVSGGTFRASQGAFSRLEFGNGALATDIKGIAVTDEPSGGSVKPTGHKFLAGTARS